MKNVQAVKFSTSKKGSVGLSTVFRIKSKYGEKDVVLGKLLTCAQSDQWISLQQGGDEVLGVNRKRLITLWPHNVI